MAYFKHLCLLEAPQAVITPFPRYISDCIGVCYLAAAVERDVESIVMPENYYNDGIFKSLRALLKQHPCDLVAISSMTGAWSQALKLARIAREAGAFVVVGGFHPTALPLEVLQEGDIDAVVRGEGEESFRELVLYGPSRSVRGLAFREKGTVVCNELRPVIPDIDTIAFPLRSLRPNRYGEKGNRYFIDTIYTSRGCPWSCSFCANGQMHGKWRPRTAENVVEEIALLHDPKMKKLLKIWDANFLTSIRRVERICDLMIERGLTNFRIMTETRAADLVRASRILPKLKAVGLDKVGIGIESPNPETLRLMNKNNAPDDVEKAVALCRKHGIGTEGYFILGCLNETAADSFAYPAYARSLGLGQALFMVMTPYPGTGVFGEYEAEKRIHSYDWDLYNNFSPVVSAGGMDCRELVGMMAYCDIAFSRLMPLLKRRGTMGVIVSCISELLHVCLLLRVNRSLSISDVEEAVGGALLEFGAREGGSVKREWRADPSRKPLRPVAFRLLLSGGRAIDFRLGEGGGRRELCMTPLHTDELHGGSSSFNGSGLRLEGVVRFAFSLSMDRLMAVLYQSEWLRNNRDKPFEKALRFLPFLADRELLGSAVQMAGLLSGGLRGRRPAVQ